MKNLENKICPYYPCNKDEMKKDYILKTRCKGKYHIYCKEYIKIFKVKN